MMIRSIKKNKNRGREKVKAKKGIYTVFVFKVKPLIEFVLPILSYSNETQ